ncbi:uncharacterized protein LOC113274483 [Papaver somniferum]|uniref:uncharacterized protein LOC113274483 n=1 Tax=Papaver somniferum TaxID=3469 RepID=UPI000E704C25|nr:uncharacterized protein LOC113274483 [Papaver somniferum]
MELSDDILFPSTYRMYGFNGTVTIPKGEVTLRVSYGGVYLDTLTTFCIVDVASPYESIIGRPWIAGIKGVASAYHQRMRFPTYKGIAEIIGDSHAARQCMQADVQINEERRARQRREKNKAKEVKAAKKLEKVNRLTMVLRENMDAFASNMHDMEGIDPTICCHHLKIDPSFKPVRQKMKRIAPDLQTAVEKELKKLQEAGIIRKSQYPQWISNMVVVPKKNG